MREEHNDELYTRPLFVSELETTGKREVTAYSCCKSDNDEHTIKIMLGRIFLMDENLNGQNTHPLFQPIVMPTPGLPTSPGCPSTQL